MNIEDKYYFRDFTIENYKSILVKVIEQNYRFKGYNFNRANSKDLIWRHDLEFSVDIALIMAEFEHELGIKANYFIQLHSPFYNTLEAEIYRKIKKIIDLGHFIGLHFDAHFYNINKEQELDRYIKQDKEWLQTLFGIEIDSFSFHNNTPFTLSCNKNIYGGLINVYADFFKMNYRYCTDSTGFWRYERLEDILQITHSQKGLHVLIHDGMWQYEILPPRQRIHRIIEQNAIKAKESYDKRLNFFGGKNIDWSGDINLNNL